MIIKRIFPIAMVLMIISILVGIGIAGSVTKDFTLGSKIKEIEESKKYQQIVAEVDGHPIKESDLLKVTAAAEVFGRERSIRDGLRFWIEYYAVEKEAKRLNTWPSNEEVENYIASLQKDIDSDPEASKQIMEYLKGRGISKDEYQKLYFQEYAHLLALSNLRQWFIKEHPAEAKKQEAVFQEYLQELAKKVPVKIFDSELQE